MVAEDGADKARIEQEIKTMPNYFADYDTTVHFISEDELQREHGGIPHGGFVIRSGRTGVQKMCIRDRGVPVLSLEAAAEKKDEIDVMILCGGSATDLPEQTPEFLSLIHI